MGEVTKIPWTRSSFNPWIGCQKVGPGCDNCYAEAMNGRFRAGRNWGPHAPRELTGDKNWNDPLRWNRRAATYDGDWWVFCASHADIFDNAVDPAWRERFWEVVRKTPRLRWQLLTKRVGNIADMLPPDWGDGYMNAMLLITVVNQEEADRDVPKLIDLPARCRGLSIEPQIGEVRGLASRGWLGDGRIGWLITGGENAIPSRVRNYEIDWARIIIAEGAASDTPVYVKQVGHKATDGGKPFLSYTGKGDDPSQWPADIRVRQMPKRWW